LEFDSKKRELRFEETKRLRFEEKKASIRRNEKISIRRKEITGYSSGGGGRFNNGEALS